MNSWNFKPNFIFRISLGMFCLLMNLAALKLEAQESLPNVCCGKLQRIENFSSQFVSARNIDVWLPDGYSSKEKYAVLYMQDGQMLYDAEASWNKQAWEVDEVANALLEAKLVQKFIVVGIWNGGISRHSEYFPQIPFEALKAAQRDSVNEQLKRAGKTKDIFKVQSDNYLKFLTQEIKPYIEKNFSVFTDQAHCFLMGSSMGGLISIYGLCEYPNLFGGAACLSTHWTGSYTLKNNPMPDAFLNYLEKKLPDARNHKIYFDCGDQTLDSLYPAIQRRVDALLQKKGFTAANSLSYFFPGEAHEERAWSKRLAKPLQFLFPVNREK